MVEEGLVKERNAVLGVDYVIIRRILPSCCSTTLQWLPSNLRSCLTTCMPKY